MVSKKNLFDIEEGARIESGAMPRFEWADMKGKKRYTWETSKLRMTKIEYAVERHGYKSKSSLLEAAVDYFIDQLNKKDERP